MASSYVNDLRLNEMATGDASGTWGTVTNTNLELIGEALGFGTEAITTNADTHTSTVADGATDPVRAMFVKYTGTLDSTCTITIAPNTLNRVHIIENATSGSQSIIISQGSGANVTILTGQTKAVYLDGAGSGAAVTDAFVDMNFGGTTTIGDNLTLSSDSAVVSFGADADTTLTHTDGSGLTLNSTNKLMFNDASQFIHGSSATVLSLGATNEIDLTATAIDINGTVAISGDTTIETGADLITSTAGTSNVRIGVNAGDAIASGGTFNVLVGDEAGTALTTGDFNTALGYQSLESEIGGQSSTAIGYRALYAQNTSNDNNNTAVGRSAGLSITSGTNNTLIGGLCGDALTDADNNVALGNSALGADTLGSRSTALGRSALASQNFTSATNTYNVAVGYNAGTAITTGIQNTLIGATSGDALSDADDNVAVGYGALTTDTQGSKSTAIGRSALAVQNFTSATDTYNTAVGFKAGTAVTTGTENTLIGGLAGDALTDADRNIAIGYLALTTNTKSDRNTAIGRSALENLNSTSVVNGLNVAVGHGAGSTMTTGQLNTIVGSSAGDALTSNNSNTLIGQDSGTALDSANNTFVGQQSGSVITSGSDNTILGRYNGNSGGLDIRALSNRIILSDGDGTIRLYIDNTGNALFGTITNGTTAVGTVIRADGEVLITRNAAAPLLINRTTNGGSLIELRKDNSLIGFIGTVGSVLYLGSGESFLRFNYGSGQAIVPVNSGGALKDNVIDLGEGSARFDDIFASNGTIQTSDRNEKQDIEELTDAEKRVAVVAKGLMRKFRWKSAVAKKGDDARTHFGIIAQDLQDAFTAQSLDVSDYAMFISTTWWEKEISVDAVEADEANDIEAQDAYTYMDTKQEATTGYTEKTRLGVRYSELLAFIISAI